MQDRREKLKAYQEVGYNHFGSKFERSHTMKDLSEAYDSLSKEELEEKAIQVVVEGRVMTTRGKDKVYIAHLQDASRQLKLYVRKDATSEESYNIYRTV